MKIDKEISGSLIFVFLSLAIWLLIPYQIEVKTESLINARFVPRIITIAMFLFSMIDLGVQILQNVKGEKTANTQNDTPAKRHGYPVLMVVVLFLYILLMDIIGFELSSILASWAILVVIGSRNWKYYVISGIFPVLVGLIFRYLFNVNLS
ncbi:MAG TPA: tripartite tricarboxylate transporter TctB family protein [Spirochaetales bacterium]|nr:tripartite tricarboxylate transporter TctB family protein [Spirochaetales bacterium]